MHRFGSFTSLIEVKNNWICPIVYFVKERVGVDRSVNEGLHGKLNESW